MLGECIQVFGEPAQALALGFGQGVPGRVHLVAEDVRFRVVSLALRDQVVQTEEQAKALSQPRLDAQGKPIKPDPKAKGAAAPIAAAAAPEPAAPVEEDLSKRKVRAVGPVFLPAR